VPGTHQQRDDDEPARQRYLAPLRIHGGGHRERQAPNARGGSHANDPRDGDDEERQHVDCEHGPAEGGYAHDALADVNGLVERLFVKSFQKKNI